MFYLTHTSLCSRSRSELHYRSTPALTISKLDILFPQKYLKVEIYEHLRFSPIINKSKYCFSAVPGIIGCLQAMEAIKIATESGGTFSQRLLLYDAYDSFRTIKLRPRQAKCVVCGDSPSITELVYYEQFCGAKATDKVRALWLLWVTMCFIVIIRSM